jgi:hypothetical protein
VNINFLLPDGSKPEWTSRAAFTKAIKSLGIRKLDDAVLYPIDSNSYVKVSTELELSGFRDYVDEDMSPIAYARIKIRGVDEDADLVEALAILTWKSLTFHWKNGREKRGLAVYHRDVLGAEVNGQFSVFLHYGGSIRKKGHKFFDLGDITIEISELFSKNGHENRRTLTFWMTLEQKIRKKLPGFKLLEW